MPKAAKAAEPEPEPEWQAFEEEEPAPVLGCEVAHAKSGHSLCKECRMPISMGALRIGSALPVCSTPCAHVGALTRLNRLPLSSRFRYGRGPSRRRQSADVVAPPGVLQPRRERV